MRYTIVQVLSQLTKFTPKMMGVYFTSLLFSLILTKDHSIESIQEHAVTLHEKSFFIG